MRSRQSGLSLVELMVAVVIGLVGILAMTQAYLTSDRFNRSTTGEGSAQTGGLIALYQMERDLRMAGYGIAKCHSARLRHHRLVLQPQLFRHHPDRLAVAGSETGAGDHHHQRHQS
jgi:prepilin-type N-terminal cleavage/methylation domain-containing protein